MITFDRLWVTMKEKSVTQYTLIKKYGISPAQITRIKRNNNINTHTINMLCQILDCRVEDIMEYHKDDELHS
jgi:putative transcriptional regulator